MAAKKVTRAMAEYIVNHHGELSVRELAEELGVSKTTVQRIVKRSGGSLSVQPVAAESQPAPPVAGSELALLQEHAGVLRNRLRLAKDAALPGISREYRETLEKITALESADAPQEKEEGDAFDAACAGIT